tara:strand:+ start:311 stop:796 length:486 start_codon:yes stop_codon:yes gene_type:complete
MPNGWKKNAKYFDPLTLTHKDYIRKKNHFRDWKKSYVITFAESRCFYGSTHFTEQYYNTNGLDMFGEYKDHSFYLSKCKIKGSGSTYRRTGCRPDCGCDVFYKKVRSKEKKKNKHILRKVKYKIDEIKIEKPLKKIVSNKKKVRFSLNLNKTYVVSRWIKN